MNLPLQLPRAVALATLLALAFGLGVVLSSAVGTTTNGPSAVRNALAQSDRIQGAPGRELVLSKVVVPPGARLALHHHLGTQVAHIHSGTLTYTVRDGAVVVRTGESDVSPRKVRTISSGQTARIKTGQWLVEQPTDIHEAANRGGSPVVIYLATLLEKGAPPATPVSR